MGTGHKIKIDLANTSSHRVFLEARTEKEDFLKEIIITISGY